jgi:hypothetical protein
MIELHLKPGALARFGLPDIAYPVSLEFLDAVVEDEGNLPFAQMLYLLQVESAKGDADWRASEEARTRLAELLTPVDERTTVTAASPEWWLEVGPVTLDAPVITILRQDELIAAIQPREDGTLRVAAYRPLDARSARLLIKLALRPHPDEGTVCMRATNWEYALDCSAGSGQTYAALWGEAYLSYWAGGIGRNATGDAEPCWSRMSGCEPRLPAMVAVELGVLYAFAE